jgi:hypothetical protein
MQGGRSSQRSRLGWGPWRFAALLGFALVAPAGLPAGGAERRQPEVRRRQSQQEPLLSTGRQLLRAAPRHQAPVITQADLGAPLRVLRGWSDSGGGRWLQVELASPAGARRGWLSG